MAERERLEEKVKEKLREKVDEKRAEEEMARRITNRLKEDWLFCLLNTGRTPQFYNREGGDNPYSGGIH